MTIVFFFTYCFGGRAKRRKQNGQMAEQKKHYQNPALRQNVGSGFRNRMIRAERMRAYSTLLRKSIVRGSFGWLMTTTAVPSTTM